MQKRRRLQCYIYIRCVTLVLQSYAQNATRGSGQKRERENGGRARATNSRSKSIITKRVGSSFFFFYCKLKRRRLTPLLLFFVREFDGYIIPAMRTLTAKVRFATFSRLGLFFFFFFFDTHAIVLYIPILCISLRVRNV